MFMPGRGQMNKEPPDGVLRDRTRSVRFSRENTVQSITPNSPCLQTHIVPDTVIGSHGFQRETSSYADPWRINDPALRRLGGARRGNHSQLPGGLRTRQIGIFSNVRSQNLRLTSLSPNSPRRVTSANLRITSPFQVLPDITRQKDQAWNTSESDDDDNHSLASVSLSQVSENSQSASENSDNEHDEDDTSVSSGSPRSGSSSSSANSNSDAPSPVDEDEEQKMKKELIKTSEQIHRAFFNVSKAPPGLDQKVGADGRESGIDDGDTELDEAEWERERRETRALESALSTWSLPQDDSKPNVKESTKEMKTYYDKLFTNLIHGMPVECGEQLLFPSTVRIFLSALRSDMVSEREVLYGKVFPELKAYCKKLNLDFEVVDYHKETHILEYYDKRLLNISLQEIDEASNISAGPYFVGLLGDKYGVPPLPTEIPGHVYEALEEWISGHSLDPTGLLKTYYKIGTSRDPEVYHLQFTGNEENITSAKCENSPEVLTRYASDLAKQILDEVLNETDDHPENQALAERSSLSSDPSNKVNKLDTISELPVKGKVSPPTNGISQNVDTEIIREIQEMLEKAAMSLLETLPEETDEDVPNSDNSGRQIEYFAMSPHGTTSDEDDDVKEEGDGSCRKMVLTRDDLYPFAYSDIDLEVHRALKCCYSNKGGAFFYSRHIEGIEENLSDDQAHSYIDLTPGTSDVNEKTKAKLSCLKQSVSNSLSGNNIKSYTVDWSDLLAKNHQDYLEQFAQDIVEDMKCHIQRRKSTIPTQHSTAFNQELVTHNHVWKQVYQDTLARSEIEEKIHDFLKDSVRNQRPLVIHGSLGVGKSCILARICVLIPEWFKREEGKKPRKKHTTCVIRFLNSSPDTWYLETMLFSLFEQISKAYKLEFTRRSLEGKSLFVLGQFFKSLLRDVAAINSKTQKQLFILLDNIGLSKYEESLGLFWLPIDCPYNVHLILTACSDDVIFEELRERIDDDDCFIKINPSLELKLLPKVLAKYTRMGHNTENIQQIVKSTKNINFLALKVMLSERNLQTSFNSTIESSDGNADDELVKNLLEDPTKSIKAFFKVLEKKYGTLFIAYTLLYDGLTESEIHKLLVEKADVLDEVSRVHHLNVRTNNAFMRYLLKHLREDLREFLTVYQHAGTIDLYWSHECFADAVDDLYKKTAHLEEEEVSWDMTKLHMPSEEENEHDIPMRKLLDLPYYLADLLEEYPENTRYLTFMKNQVFCNLHFLMQKICHCGFVYMKQDCLSLKKCEDEELQLVKRFIMDSADALLDRKPIDLAIQVLSRLSHLPEEYKFITVMVQAARAFVQNYTEPLLCPMQQCLTPPDSIEIFTAPGIKAVWNVTNSEKSNPLIVGTDTESCIVIWSVNRREVVGRFDYEHLQRGEFFLADARNFIIHQRKKFIHWNLVDGVRFKDYSPTWMMIKPNTENKSNVIDKEEKLSEEKKDHDESEVVTVVKEDAIPRDTTPDTTEPAPVRKSKGFDNQKLKPVITCFSALSTGKSIIAGTENGTIVTIDPNNKSFSQEYSGRPHELQQKLFRNPTAFHTKCKENGLTVPGHLYALHSVMVTPCDNYILSFDREILVIWDVKNFTILHEIPEAGKWKDVPLSQQGCKLIGVDGLFEIKVLDIQTGKVDHVITSSRDTKDGTVGKPCFSRNGRYLALGMGRQQVSIYDLSGEVAHEVFSASVDTWHHVCFLAFDETEQFLIGDGYRGEIKIWHIPSGQLYHRFRISQVDITWALVSSHNKRCHLYAVCNGGLKGFDLSSILTSARHHYASIYKETVITEYELNQVKAWEKRTKNGNLISQPYESGVDLISKTIIENITDPPNLKHISTHSLCDGDDECTHYSDLDVISAAMSPDGTFAVTSSRNEHMQVWDMVNGECVKAFPEQRYRQLIFTPDAKYIIGKSCEEPPRDSVKVLDMASSEEQPVSVEATAVKMSSDGTTLYVLQDAKHGAAYHLPDLQLEYKFSLDKVFHPEASSQLSLHVSCDKQYLVVPTPKSLDGGSEFMFYRLPQQTEHNSSDNREKCDVVLSVVDKLECQLDLTKETILMLPGRYLSAVATRSGDILLLNVIDNQVKIEETLKQKKSALPSQEVIGSSLTNCLASSKDGRYLASGDIHGLTVWDLQDDEPKHLVTICRAEVLCCGISHDNQYVVVGVKNKTINLCRLIDGSLLTKFNTDCEIADLALNSSNTALMARGSNGTHGKVFFFRVLNLE